MARAILHHPSVLFLAEPTAGLDPQSRLALWDILAGLRAEGPTIFLSTQASIVIQRSTRLSYSFGGDGFLTRRRSTALFGSKGAGAHGDVQYRTGRRSTVGVMYSYMHYWFNGIYGSTDSHTVGGTYSVTLSRSTQFSATAGVSRYENLFVEIVPVDPAIAAIIGISSAQRVTYYANFTPDLAARLFSASLQ